MPALKAGRVHELSGESAATFAFLMASKGEMMICGPPHWVSSLHPEQVGFNCDPNAVLIVPCPLNTDALWAGETALRSGSLSSVLIVTERSPDLTKFRRLQLAAQAGKSLGLIIVNSPAASTAAETRWHCVPLYADKAGAIRIHASLYKNKRGLIGSWVLNVFGETNSMHLDATPAGEPIWPNRIAG